MNKKGFTLIEMIIVLLFIPVILSLTLSLLSLMKKELPELVTQEEVFLLQIRQLLLRANHVVYEEGLIRFTYNMTEFEISHHNNRLVKRPGYEILLMNVVAISNELDCFVVRTEKRDLCIEK